VEENDEVREGPARGEDIPDICGITNSSRWRGVIPARSSLDEGEENTGD
jgi:hypothetical protein